jgi:hypothetical protein
LQRDRPVVARRHDVAVDRDGANAGATAGAPSGRRVITVPAGVCVTMVSTGSSVTCRLMTFWAWALAPPIASATPSGAKRNNLE